MRGTAGGEALLQHIGGHDSSCIRIGQARSDGLQKAVPFTQSVILGR